MTTTPEQQRVKEAARTMLDIWPELDFDPIMLAQAALAPQESIIADLEAKAARLRDGRTLLTELIGREASCAFYGINSTLLAKLRTVHLTLNDQVQP